MDDEVARLTAFLRAIYDHGLTTWSDTSCGTGGIGGQAFTTEAHSEVIQCLLNNALSGRTLTEAADEWEAYYPGTGRLDQPAKAPRRRGPDGRPR